LAEREPSEEAASGEDAATTGAPPGVPLADKLKFAGLIAFFALTCLVGYYLVHFVLNVDDTDNLVEALTTSIRDAGVWGVLVCLGMQFIQIVVAFIPGEVVQAAIGLVYGTLLGGIITLAGALISTVFIFYLVKGLGAPFVESMLGKSEGRRAAAIQRFFDNSRRLNTTVFILFFIPGMPKDIFTYLVPLTRIRPSDFFVLTTIARAPAVFATTFVMSAIARQDYLQAGIVAAIFGGLGIIGIVFNMQVIELVHKVIERLNPFDDE
jgi:uncharacterized membrane protein YdjX (TVP38/TMEM64 family)